MEGSKVYRGKRENGEVKVTIRTPGGNVRPLRHVKYHSPDGFEWGYGGSGPADLALSILADFFGERYVSGVYLRKQKLWHPAPKCWTHHQDFKAAFVATWGRGENDTWQITSEQIAVWLEGNWRTIRDQVGIPPEQK